MHYPESTIRGRLHRQRGRPRSQHAASARARPFQRRPAHCRHRRRPESAHTWTSDLRTFRTAPSRAEQQGGAGAGHLRRATVPRPPRSDLRRCVDQPFERRAVVQPQRTHPGNHRADGARTGRLRSAAPRGMEGSGGQGDPAQPLRLRTSRRLDTTTEDQSVHPRRRRADGHLAARCTCSTWAIRRSRSGSRPATAADGPRIAPSVRRASPPRRSPEGPAHCISRIWVSPPTRSGTPRVPPSPARTRTSQGTSDQPAEPGPTDAGRGPAGGCFGLVLGHRGQRSHRVYLSRYMPGLLSMISLVDGRTGGFGGDVPTSGDLAAVRFMYG